MKKGGTFCVVVSGRRLYEHKEKVLGDDPALLSTRFVACYQGGSRNQLRILGCKLIQAFLI